MKAWSSLGAKLQRAASLRPLSSIEKGARLKHRDLTEKGAEWSEEGISIKQGASIRIEDVGLIKTAMLNGEGDSMKKES